MNIEGGATILLLPLTGLEFSRYFGGGHFSHAETDGYFDSRGRILGRNPDKKVLRVFLLAIKSYLYSFALRFLFLQTHATSYSFHSALLYTVKEKGGKPDRKPNFPMVKKSIEKPQV